jgi:hypothetical protein
MPLIRMFLSAISLMLFLVLVAFDAWSEVVLAVFLFFGVAMSLKYLVFVHG